MTPRPLVVSGVRRRLLLLAGFVVVAFAVSAAASYAILVDVQIGGAGYDRLRSKTEATTRLHALQSSLQTVQLQVAAMTVEPDPARVQALSRSVEATSQRVTRDFDRALGSLVEQDERIGTEAARRTWLAFAETLAREVIPTVVAGEPARAQSLMAGVQARRAARFTEQMETSLSVLALRIASEESRAVAAAGRTWTLTLLAWAALGGLLLLALLWVARSITEPLARLTTTAAGIARGERPDRVDAGGNDEVGALSSAFNEMLGLLNETATRAHRSDALLETAVDSLTLESEGVRSSSRDQNEKLDQLVTDLRQMRAGAVDMAQSTERVSWAARQAAAASEEGAGTVRETSAELMRVQQAMAATESRVQALADSARMVDRFADVIAEVARETQLLALNAGLEAVKAGQHGKGFALVAARIRELANAASKEAAQVRAVVARTGESVQGVEDATLEAADAVRKGVEAADRLQTAFERILSRVHEADEASQAVELVVKGQVVSLERSSVLAEQTDAAALGNAEAVQRMSAHVEHLREVAADLGALLERLGGTTASSA